MHDSRSSDLGIELAGEPVQLLGTRALYRPLRQTLLIADLHLGKGDVFRRAGIALPRGGTDDDLQRLDVLLATHAVQTLCVLGDLLHGPLSPAPWLHDWQTWRERHADIEVIVLRGNHDRALDAGKLAIIDAGPRLADGPFLLCHEPQAHASLHVLCGHLHPLARLPRMRRRWPAFWLRERMTVLPAFSQFTAGQTIPPLANETLVACVEQAAIALPNTTFK